MVNLKTILIILFFAIIFNGCGGGGGGSTLTASNSSQAVPFTAVDPYIKNARFFWDKDKDNIHDNGEDLSTYSDENGLFYFNVTIPVGERIVMKDKGEHNGVSYTGQLSSNITDSRIISPLTTLEDNYPNLDILAKLGESGLDINQSSIHLDPMKSNNVKHITATLVVDTYLKIDNFYNVTDKNESTFSDIADIVKDLIDQNITTGNIENTVSILDYVVEQIRVNGNLSELLSIKNNNQYLSSARTILENRTDKTKPAKLKSTDGVFDSEKSKINSSLLNNTALTFTKQPIKNQLSSVALNFETIPNGYALNWSVKKQPTASNMTLSISNDNKTATFTPLIVGNYKIDVELSNETNRAFKSINFNVKEIFEIPMSKVEGYIEQSDNTKLLGKVLNQSWIASKKLTKDELTQIIATYSTFTIIGYDETYGVLVEYDDNSSVVKEDLEKIKYKAGIDNVFNRVYEGKNAFSPCAIYPDDNGAFNDGGTNWHLEAINMPEAWEYSTGNTNFLLGVCDGGFDTKHLDLDGRFATILNYGDSGGNGDHGMAVVGTIGANSDNGIGISGINWSSQFVVSYMGGQYVEDVIETQDNGKEVKLVSNSWGYYLPSDFNPDDAHMATERFELMQDIYAQVRHMVDVKTDKLFLWAGGNGVGNGNSSTGYYGVDSKYDNGSLHYKDNIMNKLDNLLIVGAFKNISNEYILTYYSNHGESVDIVAPTEFDSLKLDNGIYTTFGGTSAATPVASGVASLILSINPQLTPKQVKEIMINSSTQSIEKRYISPYNYDTEQLARPLPILNAQEALKMAQQTITEQEPLSIDFFAEITDNFSPKVTFKYFTFEKDFKVTSINSILKSSVDKVNYTNFTTQAITDDSVEIALNPDQRYHEINSTLIMTHILTGEVRTQSHIQNFTYSDLTINTIDANTSSSIPNVDFTILSNSIFKNYLVEGSTDNAGVKKVYLPYNFYNIIGSVANYKDSATQEMIFSDESYSIDLLFGATNVVPSGSISGTVYDINGSVLEGVTVTISNNNQLIYTTVTNSNGYYKINDINKSDVNGDLITNFIMKASLSTYLDTSKENIVVLDGMDRTEHFSLIKIPQNRKPIAIAGSDQVVNDGDTVVLDASASYDVDGSIVSYKWLEGEIQLATSMSFNKVFTIGSHSLTLIVTDDDNAVTADYVTIEVNEILTYNWDTGIWGTCIGDCGVNNGTQTREVICKDSYGNIVAQSMCTTTKPNTIQSCTASQCAEETYYWQIGLWSDCIGECGITNGIQQRTVVCKNDQNNIVNDSYCTVEKPIITQNCTTAECLYDYGTITSYVTNRIWHDRNLGAQQVCESIDDIQCYGNYYQWGRDTDGHEKTNSITTSTVAISIKPNHENFILSYDWTNIDSDGDLRSDFWILDDGAGICPDGFRVPTIEELLAENIDSTSKGFSVIKLPAAGYKHVTNGTIYNASSGGFFWSANQSSSGYSKYVYYSGDSSSSSNVNRGFGFPIRCIKKLENNVNNPPVASASASITTIYEGDSITFDASESFDSDGNIASYEWTNNSTLLSNSVSFSTSYLAQGTHIIILTVTDNSGATDTASLTITVNTAPTYHWLEGSWENCAGDCGEDNALQTRTVVCKDSNDNTVADNNCDTTKPSTSQACTASYCEIIYGTITSPITSRVWLDRNLGSPNICTSSSDSSCFGDYFQWGRGADGHEKVNSDITTTIANTITPSNSYFIKSSFGYSYDWTTVDNDNQLRTDYWNKIDGNGICPIGFRVPTKEELRAEMITNSADAFANLKLPFSGSKSKNGVLDTSSTYIWSTTIEDDKSLSLDFSQDIGYVHFYESYHSQANPIRCIQEQEQEEIVNQPPVANAGTDQEVNYGDTVSFDASASTDADGTIESYQWKNGNSLLSTSSAFSLSSLIIGINEITLIVTDNDAVTDTDTVRITVNQVLTYNWVSDNWGACIGECGIDNGTQNRTVTCQDINNAIVNESECGDKPTTSQVCTESVCATATITSPVTGKIWMDRNLGAMQACTSSTDTLCYGDYFQWGRESDGHEKEYAGTTTTLSNVLNVGHNAYILTPNDPDWIDNDNNGLERVNYLSRIDGTGICPTGFRVPTPTELNEENVEVASTAFENLKIPLAGVRNYSDGTVDNKDSIGSIWSSGASGEYSMYLFIGSSEGTEWGYYSRASGRTIRCIKD